MGRTGEKIKVANLNVLIRSRVDANIMKLLTVILESKLEFQTGNFWKNYDAFYCKI